MANTVISESIIPGTCQHPDGAPEPLLKAVLSGPNVSVRWRCGVCRSVIATVWHVTTTGGTRWGKRTEQAEGQSSAVEDEVSMK